MKEGWTYKKFADCIDKIPKQRQVKSKDYKSTGLYPIVSQEKELISGYWDDESYLYKHSKPIIIFGDHTKVVKYVDFDFVVGADGTQILLPKSDVDTKFFYYTLLATPIRTLGYARHFKLLKERSFKIPSLPEQQRIVSRLDSAFAHIDERKANAEKQLSEARTLFQKALTKAMEPKEGWEEKTLGELAIDMYRGSGIKRDQVTNEGIPCVRYGEIYTTYNIGFEECVSHTKEEYVSSPKYFEYGDLLFAITGESVEDIGKTIAYLGHEKCLLGGDIVCMKHNQNPKFMAYVLSTPDAIRQKGFGKTKLKVVHTNASAIKAIKISLPPLSEQQRIVSRLDSLSAHVRELEDVLQKTIAECDALKQALLRQVF